MSFSFFLATKYLKPKRSVASVITCVSIIGVMLGVAAVIIVRSVMTGFGDEWEKKILSFKPHISILPVRGNVIANEGNIAAAVRALPGVTCVTPEVDTRVLLSYRERVLAPVLLGVDAGDFTAAYKIGAPRAGTFDLDGDSIVLGVHAARALGCWVGDEVTVYSPKTLASQDEVFLPIKWKVVGIFSCGQYDYDSGYAVASLANVRDLMGLEKGVFAIHVKTDCPTDPAKFHALVETVVETAQSPSTPRAYFGIVFPYCSKQPLALLTGKRRRLAHESIEHYHHINLAILIIYKGESHLGITEAVHLLYPANTDNFGHIAIGNEVNLVKEALVLLA